MISPHPDIKRLCGAGVYPVPRGRPMGAVERRSLAWVMLADMPTSRRRQTTWVADRRTPGRRPSSASSAGGSATTLILPGTNLGQRLRPPRPMACIASGTAVRSSGSGRWIDYACVHMPCHRPSVDVAGRVAVWSITGNNSIDSAGNYWKQYYRLSGFLIFTFHRCWLQARATVPSRRMIRYTGRTPLG